MPERKHRSVRVSTIALVVALLAILIVPLVIHGLDSEFAGTDSAATETVEGSGYRPWFEFRLLPESTELESGIFALQAGLGFGVLGYALGVLNERRRNRNTAATDQTGTDDTPAANPEPSHPDARS